MITLKKITDMPVAGKIVGDEHFYAEVDGSFKEVPLPVLIEAIASSSLIPQGYHDVSENYATAHADNVELTPKEYLWQLDAGRYILTEQADGAVTSGFQMTRIDGNGQETRMLIVSGENTLVEIFSSGFSASVPLISIDGATGEILFKGQSLATSADVSSAIANIGVPIVPTEVTEQGNYVAAGDALPEIVVGTDENPAVGKGRQIVIIPWETNEKPSPTLALNGGAAVEIRRRSPGPKPGEALPPETTALPARALRKGVPYTMTFCGKYWLLDSAFADDGLPTEWMPVLDKLTNLLDGDVVGVPIVNSMDGVDGDAAIAYIERAEAEMSDAAVAASGGDVTLPTVGRVEEMLAAAGRTYTTLERTRQHLRVHCHGLETGRTYTLHLYTVSRKNGRRQGQWYHPDNYDDVPSGGGIGRRVGYARLAGKRMYDFDDGTVFPPVPEWMPNGGFLKTEWAVHAEGETAEVTVDLTSWILPMLKPNGNVWETSCMKLIGVSKATCAPLLLRICLSDEAGAVYPCRDTLRLGAPIIKRYGEERDFYLTLSPHYNGVQKLYCSIS